jgi:predicted nicotinamide N-methyase
MGHKGHWGEYTGNAKWSKDHAHTKVTKENYKASERDDAAHIDYLKRDVLYDDHHGHSDEKMTADEKHISKLAGDMKYDKEHHGSAAKMVSPLNETPCMQLPEGSKKRKECMEKRMKNYKAKQKGKNQ